MKILAYTALYRKFRPITFDEMVGQEHITRTLKNQIMAGRVGHAYLFNGGRGTGKTSAAKVLARAINCLNPKDGEPCNECEICKGILNGSLTDVVEMDAASNNSVEDIRSIREEVNFLPTKAKYRVYIIDEVHMLSTGAFNALLKTLEEPPEHVKFILATTEPQKLPATILSRCQRFDFKKISNENIIKRLKIVCRESNIEITEEALNIIAVLSEGAMRDALSILERCIQDGETNIDEDKIKDLVGIPKLTYVHQIVKSIFEKVPEEALKGIEEVINQGKDLNNILWEMIKYVKDILVYKTSQSLEIYSQEEIAKIKELADGISKERLLNLIYGLSEIENNMKWSSQKTLLLQVGIIKLCMDVKNDGIEELQNRIAKLENAVKNGITVHQAAPRGNGAQSMQQTQRKPATTQQANTQAVKPKVNTTNLKSEDYWKDIVTNLRQSGKMTLYTNLINTQAKQINDMTIGIEFPNGITPFGKTVLEQPENKNELMKQISMACGKEMRIQYIDLKNQKQMEQQEANSIEEFAKEMDIPFDMIEE